MRIFFISIALFILVATQDADAQQIAPGYGNSFDYPTKSWDSLDYWKQKRTQDFWNRTSPFFGDPLYDPMRTSPLSPYRAPQFHPWRTSPFRGDPYYDPYAPRNGRFDWYGPRRATR